MTEQVIENTNIDLLASRWNRLWAALIDGTLALVTTIPLMSYFEVWEHITQGSVPIDITIKLAITSWALFFLMHGYLLKEKGQTIGKKIIGICIVTTNGNKPDFGNLILKRYLPVALLGHTPLLGQYLSMIEVLFIFRKDKRCIHDLIAGTKVINVNPNKEP